MPESGNISAALVVYTRSIVDLPRGRDYLLAFEKIAIDRFSRSHRRSAEHNQSAKAAGLASSYQWTEYAIKAVQWGPPHAADLMMASQ